MTSYQIEARINRPMTPPIIEKGRIDTTLRDLRRILKNRYQSESLSTTSCYVYRIRPSAPYGDLIGALYVTTTPEGKDAVWSPIRGFAYHCEADGSLGDVVV